MQCDINVVIEVLVWQHMKRTLVWYQKLQTTPLRCGR
jgi:hypothetical protein